VEIGFPDALTAVGLLLIGAATASGLVRRSVLSITVLSVAAGVVLSATGLLEVEPGGEAVIVVVELVLLLTLFSDGLLVEQGLLRHHWGPAARALVLSMPLNAGLLAVGAKLLFGELTWTEAVLLGFVLSPTDPVVTSTVVASERVPPLVRHTLNLESGLNDGLALPFVLLFLAITQEPDVTVPSAIGDLGLETLVGAGIGGLVGVAAGMLIKALPQWAIDERYEGLVSLGTGVLAFGVAELVHGNGLIAAFVAGLTLGIVRHEVPDVFHRRNENVLNVLQLVAFALFGALVVETGWDHDTLALIAFVVFALVVARPISVLLAFVGVRLDAPEKLFIAWFGPKGIASMLFALFVLNSTAPDRTLIFDVAAFTILASIVAHGLTDTVGAAWVERRISRAAAHASGSPDESS
jgi:NhaP-type Na+/H+ or K+/H+ antiporter